MNPTVELVLKHKKVNMRKSDFLLLEALKSAPHLNDTCTRLIQIDASGEGRKPGVFMNPRVTHKYCFLAWRERIESTQKTHHVGT